MEPYVVARSHRTSPTVLRRLFKVKWEAVKGSEPEKGHNRICMFERSLTAIASFISEPTLFTVNVLNEYLLNTF